MKLILDTSSLIAFYVEMDAPFLLEELKKYGYEVLIPSSVSNEIGKKDRSYRPLREDIETRAVRVLELSNEKEASFFLRRYPYLGKGEIEVITWGRRFQKERIDYRCVLDDKKARRVAEEFSLKYTGTIGLLESLKQLGVISSRQKEEFLRRLRLSGFRYKTSGPKLK